MVERTIQTVKKTLRKAKLSNNDPYLAILALRTAPRPQHPPPSFHLMNRHLRTTLPSPNQYLKMSYNQHAKDLKPLSPGQTVRLHQNKSWSRKGIVLDSNADRRSYKILTDKNTIITRNRRHVLKSKENFEIDDTDIGNDEIDKSEQQSVQESSQQQQPVPVSVNREPQSVTVPQQSVPVSTNNQSVDSEISPNLKTTRSGRTVRAPMRYR